MKYKLKKVSRYLKYRLRFSGQTPLYWHVGRPNFGDDINPYFFEVLLGKKVRFANDRNTPHFFGIGSILDRATDMSICIGSGVLDPIMAIKPGRIVSLRGALSRKALGVKDDIPLGDPLVLIDRLVKPERGDQIGMIPHVSEFNAMRAICPKNIRLINPGAAPLQVITEIAQCSHIMSQSLHGLIVADALEIPNLWIAPSLSMKGGRFKFDDYFSTLDYGKEAHEADIKTLADPPYADFSVSRYTGNKTEYYRILQSALQEGVS